MNFKMYFVLALFICLTNGMFAQSLDYAEMYKDLIEFEFSESFTEETFNSTAEGDASVNPELIYYMINYLNNSLYKQSVDNKKDGKNLYMLKKNKTKLAQLKWCEQLFKELAENENIGGKTVIRKELESIKTRVFTKQREFEITDANIDKNKVDYVVWKFHSENVESYDPDKNYAVLRHNEETDIIGECYRKIGTEYEFEYLLKRDLRAVFKYSYLLFNQSKNHLMDFIKNSKNSNKSIAVIGYTPSTFMIYGGYAISINEYSKDISVRVDEWTRNQAFRGNAEIYDDFKPEISSGGFGLGFNYFLQLFSKDFYFSGVSVGLEFNYLIGEDNEIESFSTNSKSVVFDEDGERKYYNTVFDLNKSFSDFSAIVLRGDIYVPANLFNGKVELGLGVQIAYNDYSYKLLTEYVEHRKYYANYELYKTEDLTGSESEEFTDNEITFAPVLSLKLREISSFILTGKFSTESALIGVGYEF